MGDALYAFLDVLESGADYSVITSVSRVDRVTLIGGKKDARLVRLHSAPHGMSVDFGSRKPVPADKSPTVGEVQRDSDAFTRGLFS